MELRDFIANCVNTTHQQLVAAAKGLTPTQLRWQPAPESNHAGYLLFHAFRVEDLYFHRLLSPQGELWERNKWGRHFTLPPTPPDPGPFWSVGTGWTPAELAAFQVPPLEELLAYGESVYLSGARKLSTIDLSHPEREVQFPGARLTQGEVLCRLCTHLPRHAGQLDYLVGLIRNGKVP